MSNLTQPSSKIKWFPLIISIAIPLAIGFTASYFTRPEIPVWYTNLNKPSFTPPSWLFAPIWTILYILIGIAAYLVWQKRDNSATYNKARSMYAMQLVLNFLWSYMFFGMHNVLGGAVIIVLLLVLILSCIAYFRKISTAAAWLFVPYFIWVTFATALNISIVLLN